MTVVLLAACAAVAVRTIPSLLPSSSAPPPVVTPALPHSASLAADGRSRATLRVVTGTPDLTIGVANLGTSGALLRVTTPPGSSPPQLRVAGTDANPVVYLSAKRASAIAVTLNEAVSWRLELASGTTRTVADLRGGKVTGIVVSKGSDVIDLTLPRPYGSLPVQLAAGASQLLLALPSGVPVRVTAAAGAGTISLEGHNRIGVPDGTVLTTAAWAPGKTGFDIDATAGAARITITTWASPKVRAS